MVSIYVSIFAIFVSLSALLVTIYSVLRQIKSADMTIYFNLTKEFADAGVQIRLNEHNIKEKNMRCFDLLYLVNSMCHLYNRKYFYGATKDMVYVFLHDYLPIFARDEFMSDILSSTDERKKRAFYEIKQFCCINEINLKPQ